MTSRRKLLSGGSAVVTTIVSRPVSAGLNGCMTASSFGSMNANMMASHSPGQAMQCSNYNIEYWQRQPATSPYFKLVIKDFLGATGSSFDTQTIGDVLGQQTVRSGQLGVLQHVLAMTLAMQVYNIGSGDFNFSYIANVWKAYATTGSFSPNGTTIRWSDVEIIQWLRVLMYGNSI